MQQMVGPILYTQNKIEFCDNFDTFFSLHKKCEKMSYSGKFMVLKKLVNMMMLCG